ETLYTFPHRRIPPRSDSPHEPDSFLGYRENTPSLFSTTSGPPPSSQPLQDFAARRRVSTAGFVGKKSAADFRGLVATLSHYHFTNGRVSGLSGSIGIACQLASASIQSIRVEDGWTIR